MYLEESIKGYCYSNTPEFIFQLTQNLSIEFSQKKKDLQQSKHFITQFNLSVIRKFPQEKKNP